MIDRAILEELECAAYHEAGHAVVAHFLKLELLTVSIEAYTTEDGVARRGHCACSPSRSDEDNAMVHASGAIAVYLHRGITEPIDEDTLKVIGIAYSKFGDEPKAVGTFINTMNERAKSVLESRWPAVQALADALLQHGTIDGKQASELIDAALNNR